jgi:hypothetical protein
MELKLKNHWMKGNVTALMNATVGSKWDIVNLLLRRGANAKLLNDVCC